MKSEISQMVTNPTIIVAIIAMIGSSITYYQSKTKQIEEENRRIKTGIYNDFYQAFCENVNNPSPENTAKFAQAFNKCMLTGSDEIVIDLNLWWQEVEQHNNTNLVNSIYLKRTLDAMRKDLGVSSKPTIQNVDLKLIVTRH